MHMKIDVSFEIIHSDPRDFFPTVDKRKREIITILGSSQVRFGSIGRLARSGFVNRSDAEFVVNTLDQIVHFSTIHVTLDLCAFLPVRIILVPFLDYVTGNGRATVFLWTIPLKLDEVRVVVADHRCARFPRFV